MNTHLQRLFLLLVFLCSAHLLACQGNLPQSSAPNHQASQQRPHSLPSKSSKGQVFQQRYIQALLKETVQQTSQKALQEFQALSKEQKASPRLRALSLFHSIRILQSKKQEEQAKKLFKQLQKEYPKQKDLISRLKPAFSLWMQKKITLTLTKASYHKILHLFASIAKVNMTVHPSIPNRKITISLKDTPWFEALRTVVWGVGDRLEQSNKGFLIRPGTLSTGGKHVDTQKKEVQGIIRLVESIGRTNGLTLAIRKSPLAIQEEELGIYPVYITCRGPQTKVATFIGRLKLLPFEMKLRILSKKATGSDELEMKLFLGVLYVRNPQLKPLSAASASTQPTPVKNNTGSLPKRISHLVIRKIIRSGKVGVKNCANRFQKEHKRASQNLKRIRLVVRIQVNAQGKVFLAKIRDTSAPNNKDSRSLEKCVVHWAKTLQFPASRQKALTIHYPFVFTFSGR